MSDPGIQVYVVAPPAVNVNDVPAHTVGEDAEAVTVGGVFTTNETVVVVAQPPLDPVTEYVVLTAGDTTTVPPDKLPGIQV